MAKVRPLKVPPIVEAVFQLTVDSVENRDVSSNDLAELGFEGNWRKKDTLKGEFTLPPGSEPIQPPSVKRTHEGFTLFAPTFEAPEEVVDFEFKRFSYHRLPGYDSFANSVGRLEPYWERYLELFAPQNVESLSVRFLNAITIPGASFEYRDYFEAPLPVPPDLQDLVDGTQSFRSDLNLDLSGPYTAYVSSRLKGRNSAGVEIILDIKVKRSELFAATNWAGISGALAGLREVKNKLFFGSLTEKAVSLFEK